jgi:uncharacterized membrane protein YeiB
MDEGQIKMKIFLIKAADYLLFFAVIAIAVYAFLNPENRNILMTAALIGLFIVNRVGHLTMGKISKLRVDLERLRREQKKSEI